MMRPSHHPKTQVLFASTVLFFLSLFAYPPSAQASATHFVFELQSGVTESAYAGGNFGPAVGLSVGTTFKLNLLPVRWYLLANVMGRNGTASGLHEGISFEASRWDLDLHLSLRTLVPVFGPVRLYAEVGGGQRYRSQVIRRPNELGDITEDAREVLVVLALGLQARLTQRFSLGLRGELTPFVSASNLATYAADVLPTPNRLAAFAQLGVHF